MADQRGASSRAVYADSRRWLFAARITSGDTYISYFYPFTSHSSPFLRT